MSHRDRTETRLPSPPGHTDECAVFAAVRPRRACSCGFDARATPPTPPDHVISALREFAFRSRGQIPTGASDPMAVLVAVCDRALAGDSHAVRLIAEILRDACARLHR